MSDELKKCPFCGTKDLTTNVYIGCYRHTILMDEKMWNTRPIEDELRKQLDIVWEGLDDIIAMELPDEIHKYARDLMDKIEREEKK